jgi:hypothetical protein
MASELLPAEFPIDTGDIVDETYRLGAVVERSADIAVFETEFGRDSLPAVIKIGGNDPKQAEEFAERWQDARELAHPNLQAVYAAGLSVLNGIPIVYIVTERPDESLESVLAERALSANEVREMLVPILGALQYLHKTGYAHSRIGPSAVLAIGDQVKLSSGSAIRVQTQEAIAEDMRALGILIFRAFTMKAPGLVDEIPEPFRDIVRHCLDPDLSKRWTAAKVESKLNAPVAPEAKLNAPAAPDARPGLPKWVYAGVAALVLILIIMSVARRRNSEPESVAAAAAPTPPAAAAPTPPVEVRAEPAPRAVGRKQDGWWVIASAYNSREAAEKRMHSIQERWPDFRVAVSQPQSDRGHYYVTLGENLAEDQAEALRKRALELGLPRDTYIKRVK